MMEMIVTQIESLLQYKTSGRAKPANATRHSPAAGLLPGSACGLLGKAAHGGRKHAGQ